MFFSAAGAFFEMHSDAEPQGEGLSPVGGTQYPAL